MSAARRQAFIDAPVEAVWELIREAERHPEWWPRVIDVDCDGLSEGCTYREVVKTPLGLDEMNLEVERLDDCENLAIRCLNTGTFVRFTLTEAQGGTFVEGQMGMDAKQPAMRVFDAVAGQRYFRSWLRQTLEALERTACERARAAA
jgi:uncharacterized protein YndB with AHSA1/START domain